MNSIKFTLTFVPRRYSCIEKKELLNTVLKHNKLINLLQSLTIKEFNNLERYFNEERLIFESQTTPNLHALNDNRNRSSAGLKTMN